MKMIGSCNSVQIDLWKQSQSKTTNISRCGKRERKKKEEEQAFAYSMWWNKKNDKHGERREISHCEIPICSVPALLTHSICSFSPFSLHISLSYSFLLLSPLLSFLCFSVKSVLVCFLLFYTQHVLQSVFLVIRAYTFSPSG